jgi:catechol 2,3-dioxygenase-like lactoylglutathione lyase family enzyme
LLAIFLFNQFVFRRNTKGKTMRIHISLSVSSIEKSTAFYAALFGHDVSKTKPGYANFRLDEPPIHLALMERGIPDSKSVSHLGIELPNHQALTQWHSRLESAGVNLDVENEASCCYAKADKLWLTDPDGYRWEIWTRTGEYDFIENTNSLNTEPASAEH